MKLNFSIKEIFSNEVLYETNGSYSCYQSDTEDDEGDEEYVRGDEPAYPRKAPIGWLCFREAGAEF